MYHWWNGAASHFVVSAATSTDLLHWTWQVDLATRASQPTIRLASDGGYVVAWEQKPVSQMKATCRPNTPAVPADAPAALRITTKS